jgi:hypothetical protein
MDDLSFVKTDILRLMQNHYKRSEDNGKELEDKAQQIITISTVIVGLVSAFNVTQGPLSTERKLIFVALFIVYAAALYFCFHALFPRKWKGEPLQATWPEFLRVSAKSLDDYYDWVIESYIESIAVNEKVLSKKVRDVELAIILIGCQVSIIFIIIFFQP